MTGANIPEGWYPDPSKDGQHRYWDGQTWTHNTKPSVNDVPTDAPADTSADAPADTPASSEGLFSSSLKSLQGASQPKDIGEQARERINKGGPVRDPTIKDPAPTSQQNINEPPNFNENLSFSTDSTQSSERIKQKSKKLLLVGAGLASVATIFLLGIFVSNPFSTKSNNKQVAVTDQCVLYSAQAIRTGAALNGEMEDPEPIERRVFKQLSSKQGRQQLVATIEKKTISCQDQIAMVKQILAAQVDDYGKQHNKKAVKNIEKELHQSDIGCPGMKRNSPEIRKCMSWVVAWIASSNADKRLASGCSSEGFSLDVTNCKLQITYSNDCYVKGINCDKAINKSIEIYKATVAWNKLNEQPQPSQTDDTTTTPTQIDSTTPAAIKAVKVAPGPGEGDINVEPVIPRQSGAAPKNLIVQDLIIGTGAEANNDDNVTIKYVGVLFANGKEFDNSWKAGKPFTFDINAGGVIAGLDQGVKGMKMGGRRRLIIPASLAYGAYGSTTYGSPTKIPANAALIFDVDLVSINAG